MSRSPDEEKRKRILESALDAFGEVGYKSATIKAIATAAHIAPGTVYTYFDDKDDLFFAALDKIWETFIHEIDETVNKSNGTLESKFLGLFTLAESLLIKSHSLLVGMFALPSRRTLLKRHLDEACKHLHPLFIEGARKGYNQFSEDPVHGVYQIRILISGVLFELSLVDGPDLKAALAEMSAAFRREFLTPGRWPVK